MTAACVGDLAWFCVLLIVACLFVVVKLLLWCRFVCFCVCLLFWYC